MCPPCLLGTASSPWHTALPSAPFERGQEFFLIACSNPKPLCLSHLLIGISDVDIIDITLIGVFSLTLLFPKLLSECVWLEGCVGSSKSSMAAESVALEAAGAKSEQTD